MLCLYDFGHIISTISIVLNDISNDLQINTMELGSSKGVELLGYKKIFPFCVSVIHNICSGLNKEDTRVMKALMQFRRPIHERRVVFNRCAYLIVLLDLWL